MTIVDPFPDPTTEAGGRDREFAMLRHDLRGALQGILGGVGQIDPASLPLPAREQFDRIAAAARTLALLLGDDDEPADALDGDCSRFDLGRLLAFVRRRHAGEARERGLGFEIRVAENVPAGLALNPTSTIRILDNLIGNALKFADAGTVRLTVERTTDGSIAFRVSDNGPGLRPGGRERASRSGEGLGLHIVSSLAERLGGCAQIESRSGNGVEAEVRFPSSVAAEGTARPTLEPAVDLAGLRVLLAEDNPTNRMVAFQMLRALHATVVVCGDGVEALEHFEAEPVDLVVVDIEMPRLSGLDVIRAIRARTDERAHVPIVALTAYAMREHRERIAAAGANGLISKPIVSVEALGRALAGYVSHVASEARASEAKASEAEAAAPDEVAGPVIDRGTFDALAETIGPETMGELIEKVIADLASARTTLAAALSPLDRASIRSASHILISVAGAVGAIRLQTSARSLNGLAHGDAMDRIADEARRCIDEIDAAVGFANGWRATRS